jgi:hypothetical protein
MPIDGSDDEGGADHPGEKREERKRERKKREKEEEANDGLSFSLVAPLQPRWRMVNGLRRD